MKAPDEVSAMVRLMALGWGSKRIAAKLVCARNTVVVRQELASEKGLVVSLRTVERATAPLRYDVLRASVPPTQRQKREILRNRN
jgi:hypothetical protein